MKPLRRLCVISCLLLAALPQMAQMRMKAQLSPSHVGRVTDWSYGHIVVSGGASAANLEAARTEPRILFHLAERNLLRVHDGEISFSSTSSDRDSRDPATKKGRPIIIDGTNIKKMNKKDLRTDWSLSLGTGNVAQSMFPAKYIFDINGTPSCTNDFVAYGLNVAGVTNGQANVVGINNLYAGSNPTGLCGANATVNWAYNGSTAAGSVLTSVTISMDGTKVAYVESASASSVFHILTWKAGQGTVTKAVVPTLNGSCTASTSCLKSVTYSSTATDSLASAWVDYQTDKAFVASDDGKIYRISCVFTCALNSQPTVDWTFTLPVAGTGGAQPMPNGGVYDFPSGRLFVGDQLGELWVINAGGSSGTLNAGPIMIGGGGCTTAHPPGRTGTGGDCTATGTAYGIPDSVILDSSGGSQRIFAMSGNDGVSGASAVVAQLKMDLTGEVTVPIGLGGVNLHTGAFDNEYWGSSPATGELFLCGTGPSDTTPTHYWIGFTSYPVINSTPTGSLQRLDTANLPCVPYTELYNPNLSLGGTTGDHDLLMSGLVGTGTNGYVITNDISAGNITAGLNSVNYPGGISGIVIDNVSTQNQASSLYFTTLTNSTVGGCANTRCAVKLRQLNLQ
jgi:hypothetical protein